MLLTKKVAHRRRVVSGPRIIHRYRKVKQVARVDGRIGLVDADVGEDLFVPGSSDALRGLNGRRHPDAAQKQ